MDHGFSTLKPTVTFPGFAEKPVCELHSKRNWRIFRDVLYRALDGTVYVVRRGFITDLGSIPRPFRWLVVRDAEIGAASIFHDAAVRGQLYVKDEGPQHGTGDPPNRVTTAIRKAQLTPKQKDCLFREINQRTRVKPIRAAIAYYGVRLGSWWRKVTQT